MGILDDIKKGEAEDKRMRMERKHPVEDDIIEKFVDLLVKRILKREYHFDGAYDIDQYYIKAFMAKVRYKDGSYGFRLLNCQRNWEHGEYEIDANSNIIRVDTHPFNELDDEYIRSKLPSMIKEKIGGGCWLEICRCKELYRVEKPLFSRINKLVYLGKYTVCVELRWR